MKDEKKKVSRFEYAIMQAADPEGAKKLEPLTEQEELEIRRANVERQLSRFRHPPIASNKKLL